MRYFCVALAALFCLSPSAHATLLTYTETVIADGSLGGTNFTGQLVTLTGTGDTASIGLLDPPLGNVFFLTLSNATVQVGAGPAANLTGILTAVVVARLGASGSLGELSTGGILSTNSFAFSAYDLSTPITITGSPGINPGLAFGTSAGDFDMLATDSQSTFTAAAATAATPEPSSIALLATGLLGVAEIARRRRRLT